VAERYGIVFTPSFVVFDRRGRLVEQLGRVDDTTADRLRALAEP